MKLKNALYFLISLVLTAGIALAQQAAPAPPPEAPMPPQGPEDAPRAFSFFMGGGSFLGVYAEDINKENMARYSMRDARGVGITQIVKDSPAEKAGLRKDDVIVRFENDSVTSVRKLNRLVSEVAPDQTVRLGIVRGGGEQEVAVTVAKRKDSFEHMGHFDFKEMEKLKGLKGLDKLRELEKMPGAHVWKWEGQPGKDGMMFSLGNNRRIGVSTTQLTKQLAEYFGIADGNGVLITSVTENSPAAKAGLKAGDIITAVDGEKIDGAGDLSRGINKKKEGDVTLTVIRNKNQRTVNVTPDAAAKPTVLGQGGRTIVIPGVELGELPEVNVQIPRIVLPSIPEVNVNIPGGFRGPRVIRTGSTQPI